MFVNGRFTWDILRIYFEIKNSITKTVIDNEGITSMGIDTWGVDYALIDKNGRMMANPVHYRDTRTVNITDYVKQFVSPEEIYRITGIQAADFNTINQLAAEKRDDPAMLERADKMLMTPDLLNYFLTGQMATEYTIASTGMLLDAKKREFAYELTDKLGINRSLFAPLVMPCNDLGGLLPQINEEVGKNNIKVVNVASHDTASAVIAVPATNKDFISISSGTWSLMGAEIDEPLINDDTRIANFTNEGGAMGTIRFLKNITGLWLIQQLVKEWENEGYQCDYSELVKEAEQSTLSSSFDVDDARFMNPEKMSEAITSYLKENNEELPVTKGDFMRCICISLAKKYAEVKTQMERCTNKKINKIYIVGGGSRNQLLNKFTAEHTGCEVIRGEVEATAMGNILAQMSIDN
jgi:rhamnulokinase